MKHLCCIILFFVANNCLSQNSLVVIFDFDSTKVYAKYTDLVGVLKSENKAFGEASKLLFKNDTLTLNAIWLDNMQHRDSLSFELQKEMFTLIDQKKAMIYYHQQLISGYYTRKVTERINMKIYFIGLDYVDKISKRVFLIQTLYQKNHCNFGVKF